MSSRWIVVSLTLLVAACATKDQTRVTDAVLTPLSDLNLVHAEIPAVLEAIQKRPYQLPSETSCEALISEIRALDAVLGPDLDTPPSESNPGLIERGTEQAKGAAVGAAVGAIKHTTEGLVPFRGWVRKLSGAERYSKKVQAAISAGIVRRAFLKGVSVTEKCVLKPEQTTANAAE